MEIDKFYDSRERLTFDDVLIVPQHNAIASREATDIAFDIQLPNRKLSVMPVIPANMDTIISLDLMAALGNKYLTIMHRFMPLDNIVKQFRLAKDIGLSPGISIGLKDSIEWVDTLTAEGADVFCIDVAHGHSKAVLDLVETLKKKNVFVIAGNVCTPMGALDLYKSGADMVKIGIGPGSVCTTRSKTGCGYPQLSAILEIKAAVPDSVMLIADGGMKTPGDIAKALAAGADLCMTGSMFAGCFQCPGKGNKYRGMASAEAYKDHTGKELEDWKTAEGISTTLLSKPKNVFDVVKDIEGGLRSALTYVGAANLIEFYLRSRFVRISSNTANNENPATFNWKG